MASFRTTVILLSVLLSGLLAVSGNQPAPVASEAGFDYFMLSLQWPASFCSRHKTECCPQNGCCSGASSPPGFTIHGLWPSNEDGTYPSCCTDNAFNAKEISPLVGALSTYWPILSCNKISSCHGKKNQYWAHQVDNLILLAIYDFV
ncbi:ribonuclease 2-like [Bidens hawaiensis]|uniref:ribonuclease 2-like n=1 Tax=Bidens hawaiensis TaxID=980011 RepID=UPI00404B605B